MTIRDPNLRNTLAGGRLLKGTIDLGRRSAPLVCDLNQMCHHTGL